MGQTVGRLPNTWNRLLKERDRVLYWSGEVLAKVADNINEEYSLLIDYGEECIDEKVGSWMRKNRSRVDEILGYHRCLSREYKIGIQNELARIEEEFRVEMRNDYQHAYTDIKKFTKKVDKLGKRQRKIHAKLLDLESICDGDMKLFKKKFGLLRVKTFENLNTGERMVFKDKQLKMKFAKEVCKIDYKNQQKCARCVDKLIKNIEDAA